MLKVNVVAYDPQWAIQFRQIRDELDYAISDFLPRDAFDIQHVGSTSVEGLAAKPIIDIDIIVPAEHIMEATQALTSHGYTYAYEKGGIDRMVFRYNLHKLDSGASTPTEDGSPRRAVYLNKTDGAALANHLAVRDVLRRDQDMRDEYGALKMALSKEEHADIGAYGAKKQAFIIRGLEQSGLTKEELGRIMTRPQRRVDENSLLQRRGNLG
jgi:GrpB-like predicted nucleotidyltransferase (UPF0157 family)